MEEIRNRLELEVADVQRTIYELEDKLHQEKRSKEQILAQLRSLDCPFYLVYNEKADGSVLNIVESATYKVVYSVTLKPSVVTFMGLFSLLQGLRCNDYDEVSQLNVYGAMLKQKEYNLVCLCFYDSDWKFHKYALEGYGKDNQMEERLKCEAKVEEDIKKAFQHKKENK